MNYQLRVMKQLETKLSELNQMLIEDGYNGSNIKTAKHD